MNYQLPDDCGNAPKKLLLGDLNIAFAECNISQALKFVTNDIKWKTVGSDEVVDGQAQLSSKLEAASANPISQLTIRTIITHGRDSATEGTFTLASGQTFAFCNIYQFSSLAKTGLVKSITSYIIETSEKN